MGSDFEGYLQKLELIGFFSGFPIIYYLIIVIAGPVEKRNPFRQRMVSFLPLAYALAGTLYLGYLLKTWYPDYSITHIQSVVQKPFLVIWGLLSLLFWIPFFRIKTIYSLLHSLVFFALVAIDIFSATSANPELARNNMKLYTDSLLLFIACYFTVFLL